MSFYFLYADVLTSEGLLTLEGLIPLHPRPGQFLKTVKNSFRSMSFLSKLTNPYPTSWPPPLRSSYTLGHSLPFLITPQPGIRQLGTATNPRAHWSYSNLLVLTLLTLPRSLLPAETTIKALAHSPRSFCLSTNPGASPRCPPQLGTLPPLGNCE